jgi:hypothetical protein
LVRHFKAAFALEFAKDRLARNLFVSWDEQEGCTVRIDQFGYMLPTEPKCAKRSWIYI